MFKNDTYSSYAFNAVVWWQKAVWTSYTNASVCNRISSTKWVPLTFWLYPFRLHNVVCYIFFGKKELSWPLIFVAKCSSERLTVEKGVRCMGYKYGQAIHMTPTNLCITGTVNAERVNCSWGVTFMPSSTLLCLPYFIFKHKHKFSKVCNCNELHLKYLLFHHCVLYMFISTLYSSVLYLKTWYIFVHLFVKYSIIYACKTKTAIPIPVSQTTNYIKLGCLLTIHQAT